MLKNLMVKVGINRVKRILSVYPALLRVYWKRVMVYRAARFIWLINAAFPLVMMSIWSTLANDGAISGYTSADFIAYYLIAILVQRITSCNMVPDIENTIRTGELSAYLLRPIDVIHHFLAQMVTLHAANIPIIAAPVIIAIMLIPGAHLSISATSLLVFSVSCLMGFVFEFLAQYIIGGLSFWITQARGISGTFLLAKSLMDGYVIPLALFPTNVRTVLYLLPFQSSVATPVGVITGKLTITQAMSNVIVSAIWISLIALVGRLLWRKGLQLYSAVGA